MATKNTARRAALHEQSQVPIDEVARRLGLRASAIRYYDERGVVLPASRRAGRRWYRDEEIRRLAIVQYWQTSALMSLDDIRDILAGPKRKRRWREIVEEQISTLEAQIDQMAAAREFLEHILEHHPDEPPDGCHHYENLIWQRDANAEQGPEAGERASTITTTKVGARRRTKPS
jgi:DNA-binding transcriptional MerR regulator